MSMSSAGLDAGWGVRAIAANLHRVSGGFMKRFELLDCLRGVAAMAVVLFHLTEVKLEHPLVPQGYLAVDFFFVLSGFVIANAYQSALANSMETSVFIWKRVIRLYPLAAAGALFGLGVLLLKFLLFPAKVDSLPQILLSGGLNVLLLPTFWGGAASQYILFPGNGPLWSLFFELVINVLWALVLVRRHIAELLIVVAISAALLVSRTYIAGTENLGFEPATFLGGLARVCFGFTIGVLIYRLRDWLRMPTISGGNLILSVGLFAILVFPAATFVPQETYDLFCAIMVLPMIVVVGVSQVGLGKIGRLAGDLSYPLYALHYPILLLASGLYQTKMSGVNPHALSVATVGLSVGVSWAALKLYDEPLRGFLSSIRRHRGISEVVAPTAG